ncbi:MAG: HU family DNA-binding protein, partial [Rickettsiales bacterium]|nr:HU family DNA-binding protein [Rickettsiales bacterium]
MKRSDLILKIAKKHPSLTIAECEKIIDSVFKYMKDKLNDGHRIELRNFG